MMEEDKVDKQIFRARIKEKHRVRYTDIEEEDQRKRRVK
jgi:hypothetical protein